MGGALEGRRGNRNNILDYFSNNYYGYHVGTYIYAEERHFNPKAERATV